MAYVKIPKDLSRVKTKVAFNLTRRQLTGFSLAALVGLPVFWFLKDSIGSELAMIILIVVTAPFFFVTFYEKDGLACERYAKLIYLHQFHQPKIRRAKKYLKGGKYGQKNSQTSSSVRT